jgi:serine/threonine-protein kinase RsbW
MTATSVEERLTLATDLDVRPVRRAVRRIAESLPFDDRQVSEITLAVCEACMNGVRHGAPHDDGPLVTVTARHHDDHLAIEVKDQGRGFPVGAPEMPEPMSESGRGIALMHNLMDHVAIESGDRGTCVRMVKYFASNADAYCTSSG